mgnify:CR=1 FL=1
MKTILGIIGTAIAAIVSLIFTSRSAGSKAKEIELLKKEIKKEQERQDYANKIHNATRNMSDADKYSWLQKHNHK